MSSCSNGSSTDIIYPISETPSDIIVKAYPVVDGTFIYAAPARFHTFDVSHQGGSASYTPTTDVNGAQSMTFLAGVSSPLQIFVAGRALQVDVVPNQGGCLYNNYNRLDPGFSIACSLDDVSNWIAARSGSLSQLSCDSSFYVQDIIYPSCIYYFGKERILYAPWAGWEFVSHTVRPRAVVRDAFKATLMPMSADPLGMAPELKAISDQNSQIIEQYMIVTRLSGGLRVFVFPGRLDGEYSGHAVIYVEGHGGSVLDIGAETVAWLVDLGFTVYAMDLPLTGANTNDDAVVTTHNEFWTYEWSSLSPIWTEFVGPIYALAAKLKAAWQYKTVGAFGRSGGGWAVYASGAVISRC